VVDDNATNRRILEEMLTNWRMKPSAVDGVRAALSVLRDAAANGDPFRLVLSDALMPDVDGFTLARAVKDDARLAGTPLIMLTSAGLAQGRPRAKAAGFAACLSKPVKQSDLLDAILTVFGPPAATSRPPARRPSRSRAVRRPSRPLRILVAEDNATNQKLVVTLLEQRKHAVVVAPNGRDAVRLSADQPFDVILMDVQMPEMNGLEATAAIRERERSTGGHVPIVAMTAHAMSGDRERCLDAGMDAYVSKPLRPDELMAAIDGVAAPPPAAPEPESVQAQIAEHTSTLLAGFAGNRTLLGEVIDVFLTDSPGLVTAVRQATDARAPDALAHAAHALRGSIGLFLQRAAYDTAHRLEDAARRNDLTGVDDTCAALEREMAGLRAALGDLRRELRATSTRSR
jgi:CheY-like chemotaxis protein